MDSVLLQLSEKAVTVVDAAWLPLIIWSLISFVVWAILQSSDEIHPEYQYHIRLALVLALPAGFIFLTIAEQITHLFGPSAEAGLVFFSVVSPLDITVSPVEETNAIPFISMIYIFLLTIFICGVLFYSARFILQCIQLSKLRKQCTLIPITEIDDLNSSNLGLAMATRKPVQIAFMESAIIPVTFGFRAPVILLPDSLKNDQEKLNLAIRHELIHITQHDFFSHLMVLVTESFFWFHPFVHKLKRELVEFREMRCDKIVLTETKISRKKYASLLLELIPMANIDKELSVNMAQESSNLKKRITMITQQTKTKPIPKRSSIALLALIFITTTLIMACTDMQTQSVFDEEELDLMTNIDRTGEMGYHEVIIFMSEENQAEKHESKLTKLQQLQPEHIQSINIWKGDQAVERYGERGSEGVIVVKTKLDADSYNTTMKALGMNPEIPANLTPRSETGEDKPKDDFFVVVEEMPELIGGLESIQQEISYPEMAHRAGIEGRVYIQFVVTEQGDVEDARVIRGIGGGADEEALRVVRQAKFSPGMQRGKPVRVQYSLPILFKLGESTRAEEPESVGSNMSINLNRNGDVISGTVLDGRSNQPLAGANVILEGTNEGTTTNQDGKFTLRSDQANDAELAVSYIGYQTASVSLTHAEP